MAQQTAVEWLQIKMATSPTQEMVENINVWFKEAKQMEKEQICDALDFGKVCLLQSNYKSAEQYYKETFKNK